MSRNPTLILATSVIGLLLVLSCAITPSLNPQPVSTSDPNRFSTSVAGTADALRKQPDGTTYFVDAVMGLEMIIPGGWMAMRLGEEEFYRAWSPWIPRTGISRVKRQRTSLCKPGMPIPWKRQTQHSANIIAPPSAV